jgi:hypothetical protein
MKYLLATLALSTLLLGGCVKEEPILELNIEPSSLAVEAGEEIVFTIVGQTDPLSSSITFYTGTPSSRYEDYPDATAISIGIPFDSAGTNFTYRYAYNYHGPVKATFIASSYGNWSEDRVEQVFEYDITVTDNNTNITLATIKTPGIFGDTFEGSVNQEASTVTFQVPSGANLSNLTTNISTQSSRTKVLSDGQVVATNAVIDFSARSKTFVLEAPSGVTQEWTFVITEG